MHDAGTGSQSSEYDSRIRSVQELGAVAVSLHCDTHSGCVDSRTRWNAFVTSSNHKLKQKINVSVNKHKILQLVIHILQLTEAVLMVVGGFIAHYVTVGDLYFTTQNG